MRPHASGFSRKKVLVVGAGPAGSIAALVLARAGVDVRLLDRAQFPRDKLCGDTLNPGSLSILDRLRVKRPDGLPLRGMVVTGPDGARVEAAYPDGLHGLAVRRADLDAHLVNTAINAGAVFTSGITARLPILSADGRRVIGVQTADAFEPADVLIAAEGRQTRLASQLGLTRFVRTPKRWAFGAYFTNVRDVSDRGEMHVRRNGYVGVAPLPGGLTNVCVVMELSELRTPNQNVNPNARARSPKPRALSGFSHKAAANIIEDAIAADPALRARFAGAAQVGNAMTLGPLGIEARAAGCPGLLLAGDAAGFIDPVTGDGIRFALRGGELAAEAALHELRTGQPAHAILRAARVEEFGAKWRMNKALRLLLSSPRAVGLAASVASHWPAPLRAVVDRAGDVPLARRQRS